jgi:hypothetical protein
VRAKARLSAMVLCVCAATWPGAALAKPAAATRVVVVEDQGVVQPGSSAGFSERCPARAPHAIGGTFGPTDNSPHAGQFLLTASYPLRRSGWRIDVQNVTTVPRPFFAGAVCLGSPVRFAYPEATRVAPPGVDDGYTMPCPRSAPQAIGGFFGPQGAGGLGQLAGDGAFPTKAGWDIGVRNLGAMPQAYYAGAVCAGAGLRTALVSSARKIAAGQWAETKLRCPSAAPQPVTPAFAAGDAGARGQIVATDAFRTGARTWSTGVRNLSGRQEPAAVGVVCVR